ncbi:MAG: AraC family transcriptional regulator, partial [Spirochaetales bacterium]|nr:AraC family transcriptional regulator [Spirochaetales bacterium]
MDKHTLTIEKTIINKAITYILYNLEEDISVDDVSSFCGVSKYHLNRIFRKETGEAIYEFIKRNRIERSAWRLKVEKDKSVTEICSDYGYSPSNYTTEFKKSLHISPSLFRKESEDRVHNCSLSRGLTLDDMERMENNITLETLPDMFVIYERKKGNYKNMPSEWCNFIYKYSYLKTDDTLYIECTLDDPSITDEDNCLYEICQTVEPNDPRISNLSTSMFLGGKCAVYHYKGWPEFLYMVYQEVFCRWLKKTGYEMDSRPIIDIYR